VVGEVDASVGAPQDVAESVADVPGHDAVHGERAARELLVVTHEVGQQFPPGAQAGAGEAAQVVLGLGHAERLEVDHQAQLALVPDLVVTVQVSMDQHVGTARGLRQHRVSPVTPAQHGAVPFRVDPGGEPVAQHLGRGQRAGGGDRAGLGFQPGAGHGIVEGGQELRQLASGVVPVDRVRHREQRRARHPPGHQEQRVGAAHHDLGQVRHDRSQRGQHADLVPHPERRLTRPRELRDELHADERARHPPPLVRADIGAAGDHDRVPGQFRRGLPQRTRERRDRSLG
jgi:hypothetical protein